MNLFWFKYAKVLSTVLLQWSPKKELTLINNLRQWQNMTEEVKRSDAFLPPTFKWTEIRFFVYLPCNLCPILTFICDVRRVRVFEVSCKLLCTSLSWRKKLKIVKASWGYHRMLCVYGWLKCDVLTLLLVDGDAKFWGIPQVSHQSHLSGDYLMFFLRGEVGSCFVCFS